MKFNRMISRAALVLCLGISAIAPSGCDSSRDELEKTKTERDSLKTQVSNMHASMDSVVKDLADAKAQAAKCQPAPTTVAVAPAAASAKPTGKAAPTKSPASK